MVENEKKLPFFKSKRGTLDLVVWKNDNAEGGSWFSITLVRNYVDQADGQWRKTHSLRREDLPTAIQMLQEAYRKIAEEV